MSENNLDQTKIKEKIYEMFPEAIKESILLSLCLENKTFQKLPEEKTTGNHEVYICCYRGFSTINPSEDGVMILFPGSGIAKHLHPEEEGIDEFYFVIGPNNIHFEGIEYSPTIPNKCPLGKSHGIDPEDTPRAVYYSKTNKFKLDEYKSHISTTMVEKRLKKRK